MQPDQSAAEPSHTQLLPPFRPDYFAESARSVGWMPVEWRPGERTARLNVGVLGPTGGVSAQRTSRIQVQPVKGHVLLDSTMVILDLGMYFNCDGVSSDANRMAGNFDAPDLPSGGSYPAAELPDSNSIIMVGIVAEKEHAVAFLFPDKDAAANNIACRGQAVIVPPDSYRRVHFLGSSENGDFERNVTLVYADGAAHDRPWALSDWCGPTKHGEATAIKCLYRHSMGGVVEKATPCYIRCQSIPIDPTRTLREIRLPDFERMHLFAITLETE